MSEEKIMRRFLIIVGLTVLFNSCDECRNLDCLPSNYTINLRLLKQPGDNDLLFGPSSIYDKATIRFFSLTGADTTVFDFQTIKLPGTGYDSVLSVKIFPETVSTVYMELNETDTDSLQLTYEHFNTKCCGMITQVDSLRYNNQPAVSAAEGTILLSK